MNDEDKNARRLSHFFGDEREHPQNI